MRLEQLYKVLKAVFTISNVFFRFISSVDHIVTLINLVGVLYNTACGWEIRSIEETNGVHYIMAVEIHIVFLQKNFLIISIIYKKQKSWGKIKIKDKMIGPDQPEKTSGPPGPVGFTKQPARPERIFCWARPGRSTGPSGPFRALLGILLWW